MLIRIFNTLDEQAVIDLWHECLLITASNNPKLDIARKRKIDPDLFLIAERNDVIIASVMGGYDGHRGWINYLAVLPGYRRLGIGKKMMLDIEQRLKEKGCPKINLQIRAHNNDVIAFYQKIGFLDDKVIGLGKRLVDDTPFNN